MKTRTGAIFVACFAIVTFKNVVTSIEISPMIDLDSDENESTLNNTTFETTVNLNKPVNPSESFSRIPKPSIISRRHGSEFVKPCEPRKRRIYPLHDDLTEQLKIINNIQIVVNGNDSTPGTNSCEHGICDVSVSSRPDGKGNIVTNVHLSIITNAKPDVKIDDIPIIDSFRGVDENHSINKPNLIYSHHSNIPQIQTNYQGYGESWYHHRRTFERSRSHWARHHFGDRNNVGFGPHRTWSQDRPIVDDKIEPPLSSTKLNDDTES